MLFLKLKKLIHISISTSIRHVFGALNSAVMNQTYA